MIDGRTGLGGTTRRLGHGVARAGFSLRRTLSGIRLKPAERLLIAPQELEAGDSSAAVAFYSGQVMLAGKTLLTHGVSPFRVEPPNAAWARELHGFSWLRHFRDADHSVIRHHARALVGEWLKMRDLRTDPTAQFPSVVADRVIAWLVHAPLLLADAEHGYYNRFMRSLARDAQWLEVSARRRSLGMARLDAAIAFAAYTLCAQTGETDWQRGADVLAAALKDLILADGTPLSRSPADALAIIGHLLQIRTAFTTRSRTAPPELQTALDRLMAFLRLLRHPDGAIALFNGMSASRLGLIGAILAFDDAHTETPASARFGGYHRIERGASVLIVDAGSGPPPEAAEHAHAGALSFEFSAARERIIVNCGAAPAGLESMSEALRETPAHSTLTLGEDSSARFRSGLAADGARVRRLIDPAQRPKVERDSDETGEALFARHEGYLKQHGLAHERTLMLDAAGTRLVGADGLAGKPKSTAKAVLRFHLHPRAAAGIAPDRLSATLDLPDGQVWLFEAGGMPIAIEDSIFFGGLASQRRALQLVVPMPEAGTELRWSLTKTSP